MLGMELLERYLLAEGRAGPEIHAHAEDVADLLVEHLLGQTIRGDAVAEHAAGLRTGLQQGDGVALLAQVEGGGQPGRTGAHHGHRLAGVRGRTGGREVGGPLVVGEALERTYGDRLVHGRAAALILAGVRAHAAQDAGQGGRLADHRVGVGEAALGDHADVSGRVHARRAGLAARRHQGGEFLGHHGAEGARGGHDLVAVRAGGLAAAAGGAEPGQARFQKPVDHPELHGAFDAADVEVLHPGDGAGGAAHAALLAGDDGLAGGGDTLGGCQRSRWVDGEAVGGGLARPAIGGGARGAIGGRGGGVDGGGVGGHGILSSCTPGRGPGTRSSPSWWPPTSAPSTPRATPPTVCSCRSPSSPSSCEGAPGGRSTCSCR